MDEKQKILVCGDVEGRFNTLFARITALNKKSGPFDCLLCVGNFFGINNSEFNAYENREKTVPIPTYILGPNTQEHVPLYDESNFELCPNVYYLGKKGVYTNSGGLKIAYLSGISSPKNSSAFEYNPDDLKELYNACLKGNPVFRGVDVLLTSQWPTNVAQNDPNPPGDLTLNKSSDFPSWLVMKIKPRYLISGLEGAYYERAPFRCPNLGENDTTLDLVTRFLGLARVGNPAKDKWLFALSLTPLDKMKFSELMQKTTDETNCPFDLIALEEKIFNVKRKVTNSQYFYDTAPQEDANVNNKRQKRQRFEFDQSKCWFCLASPSVEKHLVITVGNSTYLALAKGGLVDEHFLICPIEHHQNSLSLSKEISDEIEAFKEALRKFYGRNGTAQVPVFFERNYKTSHMQMQAIPIPAKATKELKEIFIEEAEGNGLKLELLDDNNRLDQVLQPKVPYFSVELPDGAVLYTKIKGSFPLNFGREVLATGPVLNKPDRVEWKDCILSQEQEKALVEKIRTDFEPFDFTL